MLDINKKFGLRIQELRKSKGITQAKLAELINVEGVTMSRIENGSRFPKKENIQSIANALNVKIKDLFDFEHQETKETLINNIQNIIQNATLDDLKYISRLLEFYFESKN